MFVYTVGDIIALFFIAVLLVNGIGVLVYRALRRAARYLRGRYG